MSHNSNLRSSKSESDNKKRKKMKFKEEEKVQHRHCVNVKEHGAGGKGALRGPPQTAQLRVEDLCFFLRSSCLKFNV